MKAGSTGLVDTHLVSFGKNGAHLCDGHENGITMTRSEKEYTILVLYCMPRANLFVHPYVLVPVQYLPTTYEHTYRLDRLPSAGLS